MSSQHERLIRALSKQLGAATGVSDLSDAEGLKRCMNGLRERVPAESRRIDLLETAAEEGIPTEVFKAHGNQAALEELTRRLSTTHHVTREAANWTVNTWERALKRSALSQDRSAPVPLRWNVYVAPTAKGRSKRALAKMSLFVTVIVLVCLIAFLFLTRLS